MYIYMWQAEVSSAISEIMNSSDKLFFLFLFFFTSIKNACSTYSHAAFVNDIRQSQRKHFTGARTTSAYDISEEYSLQMNNTALLGLQRCSYRQCKRIAVVGAGSFSSLPE